METRIKKKIDNHNIEFKKTIKEWIEKNNCNLISLENKTDKTKEFLNFVYEYEKLDLNTDDFKKRKRVKNTVPACYRCNAKRANGHFCLLSADDCKHVVLVVEYISFNSHIESYKLLYNFKSIKISLGNCFSDKSFKVLQFNPHLLKKFIKIIFFSFIIF